ncbi:MAG: hypothetical protein EB084_07970 [Proteobacteria bacterium]|nr:hypothetical protein [Pseudomonadota bacterium]
MIIPRFDLAIDAPLLLRAAQRIARGGRHDDAGAVRHFEADFARWLSADASAVFVPSARGGLYLILQALRRTGRIDARRRFVIVPAWTHASVPAVVAGAGFAPWYVDCDDATLNAEVDAVPAEVWKQAAAVVVTHLYGVPARTEAWVSRAREYGVAVIEDCAQAMGARTESGERCGSLGDASYFSFLLTKNFTTLGGGMVATRDADLHAALREGVSDRPAPPGRGLLIQAVKGLAFRAATRPLVFGATVYPALRAGWALTGRDLLHEAFDEKITFTPPRGALACPAAVQADLGRALLPRLDAANARRTAIGKRLHTLLGGIPGLRLPSWHPGAEPIFMSFVIRVPRRYEFMRALLGRGVDTSPGYLSACHSMTFPIVGDTTVADDAPPVFACPNADALGREQVHLPIYPRLSDREVEAIAQAVHASAEAMRLGTDRESSLQSSNTLVKR